MGREQANSCLLPSTLLMKKFGLSLFLLAGASSLSAKTDSLKLELEEVTISVEKFPSSRSQSVQKLVTIPLKEISWTLPGNSADLLEKSGQVFIQRSQGGGGSAQIRGFEASRVLLVVDGVRMNTAISRSGHLQNLITVSPHLLEKVDILYGPSSTLYGSDALGGVIHLQTRDPRLTDSEGEIHRSGTLHLQYASANQEKTIHVQGELGTSRWGFLSALSYSDFGDLRQGKNQNPYYDTLWLRSHYVEEVGGVDQVVENPDPLLQKYSGYTQFDLMQKVAFRPRENRVHLLNLQLSQSSEVPRYDRLTEWRGGVPRFARWYYGPQQRAMAAYRYSADQLPGFFQRLRAQLSYQRNQESRMQRGFGSPLLENRIEDLDVIGYSLDGQKSISSHTFHLGLDGQYNRVESRAFSQNIHNGQRSPLDTRYPDGGSHQWSTALYAQHRLPLIENRLFLQDGIRGNYVQLQSHFEDKTFFPFPFDYVRQQHWAWSGSLGLHYIPNRLLGIKGLLATGFRAPNVDDLGKVFESAGGVHLIVPNPNLGPEYTYNLDLSIELRPWPGFELDITGFHTWIRDIIVVDYFTLDGQDSLIYDGLFTAVVANQNKARGFLIGGTAQLRLDLGSGLRLESVISYQKGRYQQDRGEMNPLDHVSPLFGSTSLSWERGKWRSRAYVLYQGWKHLEDYSPSGEDNLRYATPMGMPSWYTLNLRGGYALHPRLSVQMALENITDNRYRTFSSGISGPGRQLVLSLTGKI